MSDYIKRSRSIDKNSPSLDSITKIRVIGVGGGGCNAVERMYRDGIRGVEFIVANTDFQQLQHAQSKKIILGKQTYRGLGAGKDPLVGQEATIESAGDIREALKGSDMVFVTAGLGGGTGTGGAPEVAKISSELGALTIGVATLPFSFEGKIKEEIARAGLVELQKHTDGVLLIRNQSIIDTIGDAPAHLCFAEIDNVLRTFVKATSEIVTRAGTINVDFADVRSTLSKSGMILCGIGSEVIKSDDDIEILVTKTIENPLIISDVKGARSVLLNITMGTAVSLSTIDKILSTTNDRITGGKSDSLNFKHGQFMNEKIDENQVILTLIASDFRTDIVIDDEGHTISAHYDEESSDYDDSDVVVNDTYDAGYTKQEYTEEDMFGKVERRKPIYSSNVKRKKGLMGRFKKSGRFKK